MSSKFDGTTTGNSIRAIVHDHFGAPEEVLRLGAIADPGLPEGDFVRIRVTHRAIHPGDLFLVQAPPSEDAASAISPEHPRIPGFEGAGVIEAVGSNVASEQGLYAGQRVAFFPVVGSWSEVVLAHASSVTPIPDGISDGIAAQMLINVITAQMLLRAGHNSLPQGFQPPIFFIQSAAGSAVGRLITAMALELGPKPLRLVRSRAGAEALEASLPGAPVFVTTEPGWQEQVRRAVGGSPIYVAMDAVGGSLFNDIAAILSDGGTIVSYGSLGDGTPRIETVIQRDISVRGVSVTRWVKATPPDLKTEDIATAIRLAQTAPGLFGIAAEYPLAQISQAVEHASRSGKKGTVILTN